MIRTIGCGLALGLLAAGASLLLRGEVAAWAGRSQCGGSAGSLFASTGANVPVSFLEDGEVLFPPFPSSQQRSAIRMEGPSGLLEATGAGAGPSEGVSPVQALLMARGAAELDAERQLVAAVHGTTLISERMLRDGRLVTYRVAERTAGTLVGARVTGARILDGGLVEVDMEVRMEDEEARPRFEGSRYFGGAAPGSSDVGLEPEDIADGDVDLFGEEDFNGARSRPRGRAGR